MAPPSDEDQTNLGYRLRIVPSAPVTIYRDGFGNRVDLFNILTPYSELVIRATSIVRTHRGTTPESRLARDPVASRSRSTRRRSNARIPPAQPARQSRTELRRSSWPGSQSPRVALGDVIDRMMAAVTSALVYEKKVTTARTRSAKRCGWAGGSARISPICSWPPAAGSACRHATSAATSTRPARWPPTPGARSGPAGAAGSTSTRPAARSRATTTSRSPSAATIPTCPRTAASGKAGPKRPSPSASRSSPSTASHRTGATGPQSRRPGRLPPGSNLSRASNAPGSTRRPATVNSKASSNSNMDLRIVEHPVSDLAEYGRLPISFTVDRILTVTPINNGLGGLLLEETTVDLPYIKDYDAIEGNAPRFWPDALGPIALGNDLLLRARRPRWRRDACLQHRRARNAREAKPT